jgi:hypothetical protein
VREDANYNDRGGEDAKQEDPAPTEHYMYVHNSRYSFLKRDGHASPGFGRAHDTNSDRITLRSDLWRYHDYECKMIIAFRQVPESIFMKSSSYCAG